MHTDQVTAVEDATGVAGQRVRTDLLNGRRTRLLKCKFRVGVNITVAGAGIRNRGSCLALLDEVGLDQAGTDIMVIDARTARFFSEINSPSSLPATRLAAAGVQNVTLEETFYLYCANPRIALPMETSFIEKNINNKLKAFFRYNGDATRIVDGGTVALSNPTLRIQQVHDGRREDRPYLLPYVRQVIEDVTGTNPALRIDLQGSHYQGALIVQQETSTIGEVDDIITSLVLRGDNGDLIGPGQVNWEDLVDHQAEQFGGDVAGARSYWCYNFLTDGRLSKLNSPSRYTKLRFECSVAESASAGDSRIRVTFIEYRPDPDGSGLTAPFPPELAAAL